MVLFCRIKDHKVYGCVNLIDTELHNTNHVTDQQQYEAMK